MLKTFCPPLIEYVERFTYLGSAISSDGDVEADINTRLAKAAAVFRRLDNVWRSSTLSLEIKLDLYTSVVVSTAIYASETWKSTARICQQLDVFHQCNLRKMSWTPHGSGRRRCRPTETWRSTFKEDLVDRGVDWNSVRAVATNRSRWRTLAAHWPVKDRMI